MDRIKAMTDHQEFGRLLTTSGESDNPVWQKVLDGLKEKRRGWRRLPNYISTCGHPGVRDGGNRCVFCLVERDAAREEEKQKTVITTRAQHVEALCKQAERILEEAQVKADELRQEAFKISMHMAPWPPEGTPRQQAIALGQKWYMPLEECKHCHQIAERYVANGRCRNCGK